MANEHHENIDPNNPIISLASQIINNEELLKAICEHLMPVTYTEDSYMAQLGKPLGKMLLITQGIAVTHSDVGASSSGCSGNEWLKKGDFLGEGLLSWASNSPSSPDLPISNRKVIVLKKVEAFAIRATDLGECLRS